MVSNQAGNSKHRIGMKQDEPGLLVI